MLHFNRAIIRDAIFRKMINRNQTDTNEMATTETKYQADFYSAEKNTNIKPNFNKAVLKITDKIPRKYQEIWDINTKYRFGIGIFLVCQILGYRLTSLVIISWTTTSIYVRVFQNYTWKSNVAQS